MIRSTRPSSASEVEASLGYMRLSQNNEIKQEKNKRKNNNIGLQRSLWLRTLIVISEDWRLNPSTLTTPLGKLTHLSGPREETETTHLLTH